MQSEDFSLLSRINRDVLDGLIVLDTTGSIIYTNPSASRMMGTELVTGSKYASVMAAESNSKNDAFHQYLLDSIYDKKRTHGGELEYTRPNGEKCVFHVLTSFLFSDDGKEKMGVVIQFSDITELSKTHELHRNTAMVFIALLGTLSFFNYVTMIWLDLGKPFSSALITVFIELSGIIIAFIIYRYFDLNTENMGLKIRGCRKYILIDAAATAGILAVMVIVKCVLRSAGIMSPDEPFFHWETWDMAETLYPLTVVMQEFLTRSLVHESISQVLPTKNANLYAIAISSLFFGAIHLHLGLAFMFGAALLLGVFGLIYCKQRSIWGLCIPHYFLGLSVSIIWGF